MSRSSKKLLTFSRSKKRNICFLVDVRCPKKMFIAIIHHRKHSNVPNVKKRKFVFFFFYFDEFVFFFFLKKKKGNWHYKYQQTLHIHLKEKHCNLSNEISSSKNLHRRVEEHRCGLKVFRCALCLYSTTSKGNFTIHMQSDKHLNHLRDLSSTDNNNGGSYLLENG